MGAGEVRLLRRSRCPRNSHDARLSMCFRRSSSAGKVRRSQRSCSASQLSRRLPGSPRRRPAKKPVRREQWHLIRIPDPLARRATIAALESASALLADAECRKTLTDFDDGNGRSLADRLSSVAVDVHVYLTMVTFIDDSRHKRCASGVLLLTVPGSRVVRVCAEELKRISQAAARLRESPRSSTRSCTRWGWARTRHPPGDHGTRARSMRPEVGAVTGGHTCAQPATPAVVGRMPPTP